jgi:hypothetical protein
MSNDIFQYQLTKRKVSAKQNAHLEAARESKHIKTTSQQDAGKENVPELVTRKRRCR